MKGNISNI